MTGRNMLFHSFLIVLICACQMPDPNKSTRKPGQDTEEIDKEKNLEAELKLSKFIVQQGPIHITGTVNTNLNQRFIKLFETEGRDFFLIDSALVENGKFDFNIESAETGLYKIGMIAESNSLADIVLNPTEPNVDFNFSNGNFRNGPSATNSVESKAWREYLNYKKLYEGEINTIRSRSDKSDIKRNAIYQRDLAFRKEQVAIATKYPNSFVANMMLHLQSPNRFDKNTYWNDMDFTDVSLIHSTVYPDRIEDYMRVHASQQKAENEPLLGFYNAVDLIAQKIKDQGNDQILEFALYSMSEGFYSSGMEELSLYVVDNYFYGDGCGDAEISELFKMKAAGIRNLKVGNTSPDFTLTSSTGKSINFNSIAKDKSHTLVLFWASFCHKCEREIPEIKSIYNQYKSKGFEVVAVSVDTEKSAWQKGLKTHNTNWLNVSDLQGWRSVVSKDFRVTSTPVMFLVNSNREIVAKPKNAQELASIMKTLK